MLKPFTRRTFLAGAASLASIAVLRTPARAAAQFEYKLGHDLPMEHPLHVRLVQAAREIDRATNGRFSLKVFPNNQLGGDTAMLSQLRSGAIQFFMASGGIVSSVVPPAGIERVGFAFQTEKQAYAAMDGALGAQIRKEMETRGLYALEKIWDNGFRNMTTSTRPVSIASDVKQMKVRVPEIKIAVDLFRELGASVTPINLNEVYVALQTHVVDGAENAYATIETARYFEVQKYLCETKHMWSGFWCIANKDAWTALPADVQQLAARILNENALAQRREVAVLNASLVDKLRRQGMVFDQADFSSFRKVLKPYYTHWKGEFGTTAWDLLESSVGKLA